MEHTISAAAKVELEALRADDALLSFLSKVGCEVSQLKDRDWTRGAGPKNCYLLYQTEGGKEHNRWQNEIDELVKASKGERHFPIISGGNTFDEVVLGIATIRFFPRAGEVHIHKF